MSEENRPSRDGVRPRRLAAAAALWTVAIALLAPRPASAIHSFEIAQSFDPKLNPCESAACLVPVLTRPLPPPAQAPPRLVAWSSGVDLNLFNGLDGGIYVARQDGTQQRKVIGYSNAHRELDDHGLNLPDDHPSFSPDSRRIIFTSNRADKDNFDIWIMNVNGSGLQRITGHSGLDTEPVISPDGTRFAWVTSAARFGGHPDDLDIAVTPLGGGPITRVTASTQADLEPAWSPDGTRIAFTRVVAEGEKDVYVVNANGTGLTRLTSTAGEEHDATFSPDGTQLVITSEIAPFSPPFGNTYRISASTGQIITAGDAIPPADGDLTGDLEFGAGDPFWSRDGAKIAFFKSVLPTLGPQALFVMNADGTGKTHIPGQGSVNVHPAMGVAVDDDADGTPNYLESGSVGRAWLKPRRVRAGRAERLRFGWDHPRRWRHLDTMTLRIQGRGRPLAALRFDLAARTVSLLDPRTAVWGIGRKLGRGTLRAGDVKLRLGGSRRIGIDKRELELRLALRFACRAAARRPYRVIVQADDANRRNQEERLGRLRVGRC